MDISDVTTNYVTSMLDNSISSAQVARAKKAAAQAESTDTEDDKELMAACKTFEEYFIEQILKEGFKTIGRDYGDMAASSQSMMSYYEDNLAKEIASEATDQGGYGLAKLMYEQMSRETFTMDEIRQKQAEEAAAATAATEEKSEDTTVNTSSDSASDEASADEITEET
ncbi:MAG: rod-binding protein [Lachnospiraceae bacterium]|nr:rod-binding protein [Lachnospiraceae bacterium]